MGICFSHTPQLFGSMHILALAMIFVMNLYAFVCFKGKNEKQLLNALHHSGLFMILAEVFKQWFCYIYVFERRLNLWFFPWQLCSMAMYCSFLVTYFKKEKLQNALLVFLATFSLFSDLMALILPYDMLRDQIVLFVHSFAYHGLILFEAMLSILILKKRKKVSFLPSFCLFVIMALIAEAINVVSHLLFNDIHIEPNMFYITLAYPTTQPVFHDIAVCYGIVTGIIVYLSSIILVSFLIYIIEKRFLFSRKELHE
ncbi:MAG: YwaF family protein [Erysipelotrichaceae bacterium]|nr:YwaF family protein [Erysipelotrichaceae bacterium]MBQ1483364.1 YwaF family protein [Erysipelotrichaceae bacterium]